MGGVVFLGVTTFWVGLERFFSEVGDDFWTWSAVVAVLGETFLRPVVGLLLAFLGGVVLSVELLDMMLWVELLAVLLLLWAEPWGEVL